MVRLLSLMGTMGRMLSAVEFSVMGSNFQFAPRSEVWARKIS